VKDFYILILFNTKKPHLGNNTDPEWLDYRLDIFRRYTLRSLLDQTSGAFRIWMACSKESEDILGPKIEAAKKKFPTMGIVDFVFDEKTACDRLADNPEPLYILKIDSDDLYRIDTVKRTRELIGHTSSTSLVMFCNGYIYNIKTGQLYAYTRWSIGTYAVYFPPHAFNRSNFLKYCTCDQTTVRGEFNPRLDMSRAVCCLNHDRNLHDDPRRKGIELGKRTGQGPAITQGETHDILKEFGITP
jgi:hypothetical protein